VTGLVRVLPKIATSEAPGTTALVQLPVSAQFADEVLAHEISVARTVGEASREAIATANEEAREKRGSFMVGTGRTAEKNRESRQASIKKTARPQIMQKKAFVFFRVMGPAVDFSGTVSLI
jgi:hypothetical protein